MPTAGAVRADVLRGIGSIDASAGHENVAGYRVLRRLATGERAEILLATTDDAPGYPTRRVVVRVYPSETDADVLDREIEILATDLDGFGPRLVDIATTDRRRCVIVARHAAGGALVDTLANGALDPGELVTIVVPLLGQLERLHAVGFVHTRIRSSDILLDDDGRAVLGGWGGALRLDASGRSRTDALRRDYAAMARFLGELEAGTGASTPLHARSIAERTPAQWLAERLAVRPFSVDPREIEDRLFDFASPVALHAVHAPRASATGARQPIASMLRAGVSHGSEEWQRADGSRASPPTVSERASSHSPAEADDDSGAPWGMRRWAPLLEVPERLIDLVATTTVYPRQAWARFAASRAAAHTGWRPFIVGACFAGALLVLALTVTGPPSSGETFRSERITPSMRSASALLTEGEAAFNQPTAFAASAR